jgi:hypothetical protein
MPREAVLILIIFVGLAVGATGGLTLLSWWQCGSAGKQMRVEHTYLVPAGCMVKTKRGQWVPLSAYRVND